MRVVVAPADQGACGMLRLSWPAKALADQGADVQDRYGEQLQGVYTAGGRLVDVKAPDCDLLVFQRPTQEWFTQAVPILQAKGIAVVADVDDLFTHADPRNAAAPGFHPALNPGRNFQHLSRTLRQVDMVTVSTPALAEHYGGHGRVRVLPNRIPRAWLSDGPGGVPPGGRLVGWSGSTKTHPDDLQVTRTGVQAALTQAGAGMHVIGTGDGVREALRLEQEPTSTGWVDLSLYPQALAEVNGAAITPLADTRFNAAKSWVTPLAWSAANVPVVMSPLPEYQAIHRLGVGVLARKPREWTRELVRLLTNPGWNEEVTGRGHEAAKQLVIEGAGDIWWDAWSAAFQNRQKRAA